MKKTLLKTGSRSYRVEHKVKRTGFMAAKYKPGLACLVGGALVLVSSISSASLIKFEFAGVGEMMDGATYQTVPGYEHLEMSLNFLIDSDALVNFSSVGMNGNLSEFDFSSLASDVNFSLESVADVDGQQTNAWLNTIAPSDSMSFFENTVGMSLDGGRFLISQWIRSGPVDYVAFADPSAGVTDYFTGFTPDGVDANGLWTYWIGGQFVGGGLTGLNITTLPVAPVPEPSTLAFMLFGCVGLLGRRLVRS